MLAGSSTATGRVTNMRLSMYAIEDSVSFTLSSLWYVIRRLACDQWRIQREGEGKGEVGGAPIGYFFLQKAAFFKV